MDRNTRSFLPIIRSTVVALRKESVDRNHIAHTENSLCPVALRKESVDRNCISRYLVGVYSVALRKESVDRNFFLVLI